MNTYLEKNVVVGPFQCNCRILVCPKTLKTAIIDPGDEPERIVQHLKKISPDLKVEWLLHTHAHLDHIGGTRGVSESVTQKGSDGTAPRIALHADDEEIYNALQMQGQMFGIKYDAPLPVTHRLRHEEEIRVGELRFSVVHTPGHSPGSVCLRLHEDSALGVRETLFSGDTLFQGSVGRTDLWGADGDLMFKMIRTRILTLDGDTRVCPGHGGESKVGIEKKSNPFLV